MIPAIVIDSLQTRFPNIEGPDLDDICYATQNRQSAARDVAKRVELLLVVGAKNSSNSNRLCEIGKSEGVTSYLIDDASMIDGSWIDGISSIGITAGASAPEILVEGVIDYFKQMGEVSIESLSGIEETMRFNLPKELKD